MDATHILNVVKSLVIAVYNGDNEGFHRSALDLVIAEQTDRKALKLAIELVDNAIEVSANPYNEETEPQSGQTCRRSNRHSGTSS